jgi:hypothetical protein
MTFPSDDGKSVIRHQHREISQGAKRVFRLGEGSAGKVSPAIDSRILLRVFL